MEIKLNYKEVEKLTGLKNIKFCSKSSVQIGSGLFKYKIKLIRIYNNTLFLDLGFIRNLIANKRLGNDIRGDRVLFKIKKADFIKIQDIEVLESEIKLRGEI